jgi:hypothetical protein
LHTFPRPGSSEALSIGPGAAARDSRAAAIDRRRDLLDMSNFGLWKSASRVDLKSRWGRGRLGLGDAS